MDCSPWGRKESDTTEQLSFHFIYHNIHIYIISDENKSKFGNAACTGQIRLPDVTFINTFRVRILFPDVSVTRIVY